MDWCLIAAADPSWLAWTINILKVAIGLGLVIFVHELGHFVVAKLGGFDVVPGWASIVVPMGVLGGVQLTVLGVIGEYVARIHDEVKQRPLYLGRDLLRSEIGP